MTVAWTLAKTIAMAEIIFHLSTTYPPMNSQKPSNRFATPQVTATIDALSVAAMSANVCRIAAASLISFVKCLPFKQIKNNFLNLHRLTLAIRGIDWGLYYSITEVTHHLL